MNNKLKKSLSSLLILTVTSVPDHRSASADRIDDAAAQGRSYAEELNQGFSDLLETAPDKYLLNPEEFRSEKMKQISDFDYSAVTGAHGGGELEIRAMEQRKHLNSPQSGSSASGAYRILTDTRKNFSVPDLSSDPVSQRAKEVYRSIDGEEALNVLGDCTRKVTYRSTAGTSHLARPVVCNRLVDRSSECTIEHSLSTEPVVSLVKGSAGDREAANFLNIRPCQNENCFELWVGAEYGQRSNWCDAFHDHLYIKVDHPEAITGVFLSYVKWDDYFAAYIGRSGREKLLFNAGGTLPIRIRSVTDTGNLEAQQRFLNGETVYVDRINGDKIVVRPRCENKGEDCRFNRCNYGKEIRQGATADGTDLTAMFTESSADGEPIVFHTVTSTADTGNYQARLKIYYDPARIVRTDKWSPADCIESAKSIDEKFAGGFYRCEEMIPGVFRDPAGSQQCLDSGGIRLCEGDLESSLPLQNISALCQKVKVNAVTTYYRTEDDHEQYRLDGCADYRGRCAFISSKCVSGASDSSGNCYDFEEMYDCGVDFDDQIQRAEVTYDCNGSVRCIGDECAKTEYSASDGFARASALLNAAQFMGQDLECTGLDPKGNPVGNVDVHCRIFAGTAKNCAVSMKGLGGLEVNCCDYPGGITPSEYISALLALPKIDAMIARTGPGNPVYGAYNAIRTPVYNGIARITNTLKDITRPFTSWMENNFGITTASGATDTASKGIMESFTDILKSKAREIIKKIILRGQSSTLAQSGAAGAGGTAAAVTDEMEKQAGEQAAAIVDGLGTALSVVGYVYMVYQIGCMASRMIFKCRDEQIALAASRELGNCSYVGQYCSKKVLHSCIQKTYSYCCYSSPLSRIIQEQIHLQLGRPIYGLDPKHPDCGGIEVGELEKIDWEHIDLSEWSALLKITGNMPSPEDLNPDILTGAGSMLNIDYSSAPAGEIQRKNVMERTAERIFDIDTSKVNREVNLSTAVDPGDGREQLPPR